MNQIKDTATEKYVDILGNKTLWLRCIYGKDKPAITDIGLYYFKQNNDTLIPFITIIMYSSWKNNVLKEKGNMILVPIFNEIGEQDVKIQKVTIKFIILEYNILFGLKYSITWLFQFIYIHIIRDGLDHWSGRYDLTQLLYADQKPGFAFGLSYRVQNQKNYGTQILKVKVITAKSSNNNKLKNGDFHVVIPIQFEIINYSFGIDVKNRVFAYMKEQDIHLRRFKPSVLDRYPLTDHSHTSKFIKKILYKPFPDAVSQFCFPEGLQFKRDNNTQPESFSFVLTLQDGCRIYCTCLIFNEIPDQKVKDLVINFRNIYIQNDPFKIQIL